MKHILTLILILIAESFSADTTPHFIVYAGTKWQ